MSDDKKKNSRLGKGLSALIGEYDTFDPGEAVSESAREVTSIPVARIKRNPNQPRKQFDEEKLAELTESVRDRGVLIPILVREVSADDHDFQIIAGERRFRAAKAAGLTEIGLIENIQREDLNAMEEAEGYQALMTRFGKTQDALAKSVGKSRAHVANMLRLLNLPDSVRTSLRRGDITAGHARAALAADNPDAVIAEVLKKKLSVRETEALARRQTKGQTGSSTSSSSKEKDIDTEALEADLSRALGLIVDIRTNANGGEVRIKYRDLEQLDDICRRLTRG